MSDRPIIRGPLGPEGPDGPPGPPGIPGATGAAGAPISGPTIGWGAAQVAVADTYYFVPNPSASGVITGMTSLVAGGGSVTSTVNVAGSPVGGLASIVTSSPSPTTTGATSANSWTPGQAIEIVITCSGTPVGFVATLNVT